MSLIFDLMNENEGTNLPNEQQTRNSKLVKRFKVSDLENNLAEA